MRGLNGFRRAADFGAAGVLVAAASSGIATAAPRAANAHAGHATLAKTVNMHAEWLCAQPSSPGTAACLAQKMVPNKGMGAPNTSTPRLAA